MDVMFWYLLIATAMAGLAFLYGGKKYTLPGYKGEGNWGAPIIAGGIAILVIWGLAALAGLPNIWGTVSTSFEFARHYNDDMLKWGAWFLVGAMTAIIGVVSFNLSKYGRATM